MTLARDGHLALCPAEEWFESRSYRHDAVRRPRRACRAQARARRCRCQPRAAVPRGRADTIGADPGRGAARCASGPPLVDQVVVVDAGSRDGTRRDRAPPRRRGLRRGRSCCPQFGPVLGKGDAMWRALSVARGDLVVFADADTRQLRAPLRLRAARPAAGGAGGAVREGDLPPPVHGAGRHGRGRRRPRHRADREAAARRSSTRSWPGSGSRSRARWPRAATCCARSRSAPATRSRPAMLIDVLRARRASTRWRRSTSAAAHNRSQRLLALGSMSYAVARAVLLRAGPAQPPVDAARSRTCTPRASPAACVLEQPPRSRCVERPPMADVC